MTGGAFDAFMDGYGASMDMFPVCRHPSKSRSADKIWADFVRVAMDMNKGLGKVKLSVSDVGVAIRHSEAHEEPKSPRRVSAG
jgi:hypothetical protein